MATQSQCCEYAEVREYTAADGVTVLGCECPICGAFTLSPAWDRISKRSERELSPRRLHAVSA